MNANAYGLLRHLEEHHVAPSGEHALDLEQAADLGLETPEPVMLLTNAALYARAAARSWTRVPLSRIQRVTVATDPSGMLTRYTVAGETGETVVDVALPMARSWAVFLSRIQRIAVFGGKTAGSGDAFDIGQQQDPTRQWHNSLDVAESQRGTVE